MTTKIRVAVAGGTGYTGVELLRFLVLHPAVDLRRVTSEQYAGRRLSDVFRSFRGGVDPELEVLDPATLARGVDVVFSALPHGTAAGTIARVVGESDARVIDLSADFRLRDPAVFGRVYGEHPAPELLAGAVYGIPEFSRDEIRSVRIVAVPGCYPTGALFGLVPLAQKKMIGPGPVIIDSKSGASGAGRAAKTEQLFSEVHENVRAYGVGTHRHGPEIEQELRRAGGPSRVIFTPHLLPIRRGILTTIYVPLGASEDLAGAFESAYGSEPFVQLLGPSTFPEVRDVRGTNNVQIGWAVLPEQKTAIVVTAIDNLGKGAAGQAVQCLNVMFGLPETTGLGHLAAVP